MTLALGTIRTLTRHARPGTFESMVIQTREISELVRLIPGLMMERVQSGVIRSSDVKAMGFRGCYTLDGELFTHLDPEDEIWVRGSDVCSTASGCVKRLGEAQEHIIHESEALFCESDVTAIGDEITPADFVLDRRDKAMEVVT